MKYGRLKIKNYIVLLVGKSGVGKSTIENIFKNQYGYKPVRSYTTRAPRYENEESHIFVSEAEYQKMKDDMCAFTEFDGNKYWATNAQVDESDIYVIDPAGIDYFKKHYKGKKKIISVELLAHKSVRYKRMRSRGDSVFKAIRRIRHDKKAFAKTNTVLTVNANINNPTEVAKKMHSAINMMMAIEECMTDET